MEMIVAADVMVPMRDGVRLAADVYRVRDAPPAPVLLQRNPYGKASTPIVNNWVDVRRCVEAGYVVVVQDTRGRFASEGRFEPFVHESADGTDTVAWLARQPWCDGRVVMCGGSYTGTTQWLAAAAGPEPLRAIAPATTSADVRDGWARRGGARQLGFVALWIVESLVLPDLARRAAAGEDVADVRAKVAGLLASAGGVYEQPADELVALLADVAPYAADWLRGELPPQVPRVEEVLPVDVPVLSIGGWYDLFLDGTLAGYAASRRSPSSRLVIGPWAHGAHSGWFPQRWFGPRSSAAAIDLTGVQLTWFEEVLAGREVTSLPPVRLFVMGPDEWRDEQEWPLARTRWTEYRLGSDGPANTAAAGGGTLTVADDSGGAAGVEVLRHDPADPVPAVGGAAYLPGLFIAANTGPRDQRAVEARPDVLCFTSEPLAAPLEVTGPVTAHLFVSDDGEPVDVVARLVDVAPDGAAMLVCDGIRRPAGSVVPGGQAREVEVRLSATSYVFGPGHRIRLDVTTSCFPRFDLPCGAAAPATESHLHHGPPHPSRLVLPVVPAEG